MNGRTRVVLLLILLLVGNPQAAADEANAPDTQPAKAMTAEDLFRKASPAVVRVIAYAKSGTPTALGSGVFVSPKGVVATNWHVVKDAHAISVVLHNNATLSVGKILGADEKADLALLQTKGKDVPFVPLAQKLPDTGARVYAIGNPEGFTNTISDGLVSGYREDEGVRWLQTTAAVSHGSSGGPLIDERGELVGITTFTFKGGQSLNFASPLDALRELLRSPRAPGLKALGDPEAKKRIESIAALLKLVPEKLLPEKANEWSALRRGLFEKWCAENIKGSVFAVHGAFHKADYISGVRNASGGLVIAEMEGQKITYKGIEFVVCIRASLEKSSQYEVADVKKGTPVSLEGVLVGFRALAPLGDRWRRYAEDWHKNPNLRKAPPPSMEGYTSNSLPTVDLTMKAVLSVRQPGKAAGPGAQKEVSPEVRAKGQLGLAESYLSAGLKAPARKILKAIVKEYPDTEAAKKAAKKLKELDRPAPTTKPSANPQP